MCKHGTEVILDLPPFIQPDKEVRTVSIDSCIVEQVKALWVNKIYTLGCCCGHGKTNPDVIIEQGYDDQKISQIVEALKESDPHRCWQVLQWRLNKVGETSASKIQVSL